MWAILVARRLLFYSRDVFPLRGCNLEGVFFVFGIHARCFGYAPDMFENVYTDKYPPNVISLMRR